MCVDEKYYKSSSEIKCKDGSKKFTRAQLNDDFCDCPDGTDEPGSNFLFLQFPLTHSVWFFFFFPRRSIFSIGKFFSFEQNCVALSSVTNLRL